MKKLLFSSLCFLMWTASINAQDIFASLYLFNIEQPIYENIDSITTYTYNDMNMEEGRMPDTFVIINQDSLPLFLYNKLVETYPNPRTKVGTSYDHKGKLKYTETTTLDEEGLLKENTVFYGAKGSNHFMNSVKSYEFENARIAKVTENNTEIMVVEYDENGLPSSLRMDIGFVKMSYDRKKNESGYIYHANMIPSEGGALGFIGKAMKGQPKSYMLYEVIDENHNYTHIEEDKETKEIISKSVYIRNNKGQLIESIEPKNFSIHKKYKYHENGELKEVEDLTNETKMINEFDEDGNYIKKFEESRFTEYEYDANKMVIEERDYFNIENSRLIEWRIKKIDHKK